MDSERAYMCTLMPFSDLPDEQLKDSVPRSPLTNQCQNKPQQTIHDATNKIHSQERDIKLFLNLTGQLDDFLTKC